MPVYALKGVTLRSRPSVNRTSDLFNSGQELGGLQPLCSSRVPVIGIARELPVARKTGWLVLGLRPAGARGVRSGSKEVCARHEVGMSFARVDGGGPTETEVCAHEGAHRGRSP